MWLMKCHASLSRSLFDDPTRPVARLTLSIESPRLRLAAFSNIRTYFLDDAQVTMELIGNDESGNAPKCCYSMDMSKDFTSSSVFSESSQGKITVEGKILNKFDMRLHQDSIEKNEKLSSERKTRYRTKSRPMKLTAYGGKCQIFQDAFLEANEVFVSFKQEIEKMAKSIKELNKQNLLLKRKCEKSDITLMEIEDEHEQLKKQLNESKNQKEELRIIVPITSGQKETEL
ncbi:hypothetical protein ACOSQ2_033140 [Xanthoceras sorbifolium]